MTGKLLAEKIIQEYGNIRPTDLAQKAGCTLVFERWYPATYGEFHVKTQQIVINLNAPIPLEEVIAHELGHFFIQKYGLSMSRAAEETLVNEFAITLLSSPT